MNTLVGDAVALREAGRYAEAEDLLAGAPALDAQGRAVLRQLRVLQAKIEPPADAAAAVALAAELAGLQGAAVLQGADEGPRLQRAAELVLAALPDVPPGARAGAAQVLRRVGAFEAAESLGSLAEIGRVAAQAGDGPTLLRQLARVAGDADRLEVMAQHRLWAARLEAQAATRPIARRGRGGGGRMRLGFLSSDLRSHVVAFFVQPLFQYIDVRFELYAYSSWPGPADPVQQWFAGRAAAFRQLPPDDHAAAQMIADDGLDLLIELGGLTGFSRPGVLAYRPAPRQASWLGYPQSLGLSAIDDYIADPYLAPTRPELLAEAPLRMPHCWITMAPAAFPPSAPISTALPAARKGHVTFGTMNDAYKLSPAVIETWAEVLARTPGSRFMIVRPECGAPIFRENVGRRFAAAGVAAERLDFRAVRGGHKPLYGEIDIALDTFPVTGGVTTCEALWAGVPTVTLGGEAPYERLSWSILANAGLGDLVARDRPGFVATAVALAGDLPRLAALRAGLRERIAAHPLGQPMAFAADFYELVAGAIADGAAASS